LGAAVTDALVFSDGRLLLGAIVLRAAVGRGGLRADKREGDGATPVGPLELRRVLYRADRTAVPRTLLPREPIGDRDGWCDDPAHRDYNRMVTLPHPARHEQLWRSDSIYDITVVLGWNDSPVARGRGSAIFLHLARPGYPPTEGCIALSEADLRAVLAAGVGVLRVMPP